MKTTVLNSLLVALSLTASLAQADWRPYDEGARQKYDNAYEFGYPAFRMHGYSDGMWMREVEERLDRQMRRIQRGRESGQLTRWEFRSLMREHQSVRHLQRVFIADGHMSRFEFRELHRTLDAASQRIRAEKHDSEARSPYFDYHAFYR